MAAIRGATIAIDADRNCNFKGSNIIRLSKFNLEDALSLHDGGALLYSRTDCFLDLSLADLRVSNIRSNVQPNGTLIPQMNSGLPLIDDVEGGGLIKVTSNSLKLMITNSSLMNISSQTGVGGLFNFNHREFQGTL